MLEDFQLPHRGFVDGERPRYEACRDGCGMTVRADRLDLLDEHRGVCPNVARCAGCGEALSVVLEMLGARACSTCVSLGRG